MAIFSVNIINYDFWSLLDIPSYRYTKLHLAIFL